jgi:hypothetical protein
MKAVEIIDRPRLVGASLRLDARVLRDWVPARARLAAGLVGPPGVHGGPTG